MTTAGLFIVSFFTMTQFGYPADQEDVATETRTPSSVATQAGTKRALIICGLPGDAEHHKTFAETTGKLREGLSKNLGFDFSNIVVMFGDEPKESDEDYIKAAERATREELENTTRRICEASGTDDALWVIVLGHSHYDANHSWINLPGPDINEFEFAKLFSGLKAREQVFFLTIPTSGFFIKPLSAKERIVISATEEAWETNETEFPHELARVLTNPPITKDFDVDEDGAITVFDLYVTLARNIAQSFLDGEFLATEHPLFDDNGDGRGTDVQIDYLTVEQGGRVKRLKNSKSPPKPNAEGIFAKSITLPFPLKEAPPPETPKPADEASPNSNSDL